MNSEYTMIAEARGQEVLWFRRFGAYQGDWMMLSRDESLFYVWKDYYGSCSVCDRIQATFDYTDKLNPEDPKVQEFVLSYKPHLEMTHEAALRLAQRDGNLLTVLPANRYEWELDGPTAETVGRQFALVVLSQAGKIGASEILEFDNQEARREAIERFGTESWVREIDPVVVDTEGENVLMRIDHHTGWGGDKPYAFLFVRDSSTERRYVLRTDPAHQTVREARAASFAMDADRFVLAQET